MTKGGLLIRLIDIALIILFGFISISDINVKAQIKLPKPVKESVEKSQNLFLVVRVLSSGQFELDDTETTTIYPSLDELESGLKDVAMRLVQPDVQLHVLVKPEEDSIVQHTVSVLDLCTKLELPKNIAYNYDDLNL